MWRTVILFALISLVVVPILIQQINRSPKSDSAQRRVDQTLKNDVRKRDTTSGDHMSMKNEKMAMMMMEATMLPPVVANQSASSNEQQVQQPSLILLNPFRRKIMSEFSFNSSTPANISNQTTTPDPSLAKLDILPLNTSRVKDLQPPPSTTSSTTAVTVLTSSSTTVASTVIPVTPATTVASTPTTPVTSPSTPISVPSTLSTTTQPATKNETLSDPKNNPKRAIDSQANNPNQVPASVPVTPVSITTPLVTPTTPAPAAKVTLKSLTNTTVVTEDPIEKLHRRIRLSKFVNSTFADHGLNASSAECQTQLDQTDGCFRTVMLIDEKYGVPKTFAEIDSTFCKNNTSMLKCLGGYAKCLKRIPRILYNFLYLQVKKLITDVCRQESFREDILYHGTCFKPGDIRVVSKTVDQGTIFVLYVLKHVPIRNVIPWGCCGFYKTYEDGVHRLNQLCSSRTGNATGEFVMDFMKSAASDLLDIGCRRYSSVESCRKNLPEAMKVFDDLSAADIPPQKYSPIIPLVEITRRMSAEYDDF